MRNYTPEEIINGLREALAFYAKPENQFSSKDICLDDCSGFYLKYGEKARQALNQWNVNTRTNSNE